MLCRHLQKIPDEKGWSLLARVLSQSHVDKKTKDSFEEAQCLEAVFGLLGGA